MTHRCILHLASCIACFCLTLGAAASVRAQVPVDVWRNVAEKIDVGTEVRVELQDGRAFNAILVGVRDDTVLLQPKVRVTVPVQEVPFASIAALERHKSQGAGIARAVAIGAAVGAGAFFGMLMILLANVD